MRDKDLLKKMAMAMASEDWATVAQVASQMAGGDTAPPAPEANKIAKTKKTAKAEEKPASVSTNQFKDDLSLEKSHIATDKKLNKKIRPAARRPPSQNLRMVDVVCPKCSKSHQVTAIQASMRREIDSGVVCAGCLRRGR